MFEIIRWSDGPSPRGRTSLPGGCDTVRALIEAGDLHVGELLACGQHTATVLADGRLRLHSRPYHPFASPSGAVSWALGCSEDGWRRWRCVRDGELLDTKRHRWMGRTVA